MQDNFKQVQRPPLDSRTIYFGWRLISFFIAGFLGKTGTGRYVPGFSATSLYLAFVYNQLYLFVLVHILHCVHRHLCYSIYRTHSIEKQHRWGLKSHQKDILVVMQYGSYISEVGHFQSFVNLRLPSCPICVWCLWIIGESKWSHQLWLFLQVVQASSALQWIHGVERGGKRDQSLLEQGPHSTSSCMIVDSSWWYQS